MSSCKENIWRVRYEKLQEYILAGRRDILLMIGRSVVNSVPFNAEKIEQLKMEHEVLQRIYEEANNLRKIK